MQFAIVVHGGAGSSGLNLTDEQRAAREASLERAIKVGLKILREGGSSLDAVEQTIRVLEDDPHFNAGRGAVMNNKGSHELDASIMDGSNKACGAVAGVTTVKNPISLARLVMTKTRHVLLGGAGADKFAEQQGVELVEQNYFFTERQLRALRKAQQEQPKAAGNNSEKHMGTVGCAALDKHGNLAAGTSTGGLTNKQFGRIGDSPIVGAGTYADNATCAVSCTGIGEHYIRNAVAYDISAQMAYKKVSVDEAVKRVIEKTLKPGYGGIIAVDRDGAISMRFNTAGMARAAADSSGRFEVHVGQ